MKRLIAVILALLLTSPAWGQGALPPTPPNTVWGRLGINTGPAQAIPFATLTALLFSVPTGIQQDVFFGSGRPWCDVRANGAKGDAVTDDSAAFAKCVTTLTAVGGGILYASTGVYQVNSGVTITGSIGISLFCAQYNSTEIRVGTIDVSAVTLNNAPHEIRNCLITGARKVNATTDAISLGSHCTECKLDRVEVLYGRYAINDAAVDVRMSDMGIGYAYGAANIYSTGAFSCYACKSETGYPSTAPSVGTTFAAWQANHAYASVGTVVSTAGSQGGSTYLIQLVTAGTSGGSAPTLQPYFTNITDGTAVWQLVAQSNAAFVQLDTGSSTTVINGRSDLSGPYSYGLYMSGNSQSVSVSDSFIGGSYLYGIYDTSTAGGLLVKGTQVNNCVNPNCVAIYVHGIGDVSLVGNNLIGNEIGIDVDSAAKNVTIANNDISSATSYGIFIGASVTQVSVTGNLVGGGVTWAANGTGIFISATSTDYITVLGNQCHGASTCITNNSTGTHNFIESTPGVLLTGPTLTVGPTMSLGSDGTGDTYYRNSSGILTRLAVGGSHQFLGDSGGLPAWAQPACGDLSNAAASCSTDATNASNISSGTLPPARLNGLSAIANSVSSPVTMTTKNTYYDGPSIAQGGAGTWWVSGTVKITSTAGDLQACKLWDGTTVIASGEFGIPGGLSGSIALSGYLATPAGNIKISCTDTTTNGGTIDTTANGAANASILSGFRIN